MSNDNYPVRLEAFDVVLLKDGVNPESATPDDFKRVAVTAPSPLAAQMHDDAKVDGYSPIFGVPPGHQTDPEVLARQRALNGPQLDRSEILGTPKRSS